MEPPRRSPWQAVANVKAPEPAKPSQNRYRRALQKRRKAEP